MKKKTSSKKLLAITLPISLVSLAILIAAPICGNVFSDVLDTYVGKGQEHITSFPGSDKWDSQYYSLNGMDAQKVNEFSKNTTRAIAEEGITLLKNENNTLPLTTSKTGGTDKKISLFGRRSIDTVFGGTGSGSGDASQCTTIINALKAGGYDVNPTLSQMYQDKKGEVPLQDNQMDNPTATTYYIGELPQSYYTSEVKSSFSSYSDAAIIVLGMQGGEGMDFATDLKHGESTSMDWNVAETKNYKDGQHQLELTQEEKDMLDLAKSNFGKVIVVINSANPMEIDSLKQDEGISSILWLSYPGSTGTEALTEILNGTVNPSGHTIDTWASDLTQDPTFLNSHAEKFTNVDSTNALADSYKTEYEEGIYVGYRYYETRYATDNRFTVEGVKTDYDHAVSYPFGYGLSYTTFDQKITSHEIKDGNINVTVEVENTGSVEGKDVIQLYYHAPYTAGGIEKSDVVLGAFAKTDLLKPNEKKEYTLSYSVEDMASYDYKNEKCYVLDAGTYTISLRKNSHEVFPDQSFDETLEKVVYNDDNPRQREITAQKGEYVNLSQDTKDSLKVKAATNQFDYVSDRFVEYGETKEGKATNFTRADFSSSFPTAPKGKDLAATDTEIKALGAYTPDYYDSSDKMPTQGDSSVTLSIGSFRGLTYDDPKWETLLNKLTVKEMSDFLQSGNQGTGNIKSISLPQSKASDGPAGLKQFGGIGNGPKGNFNCSSTLTAASFNVELAKQYGIAIGNECLISSPRITGWYAPGANIHRSAFGGRNFEYYSEDPLLSGKMAAGTVSGSATKGVECYMKHFALNDMESHRTSNGQMIYANEQAMREIYLRPFEIAIEEPVEEVKYLEYSYDANGSVTGATSVTKKMRVSNSVMSSFSRIGPKWVGNTPELLKNVLRGEWGFLGNVVTDYNGNAYMSADAGIASGNDLMLANLSTLPSKIIDTKNASTVKAMRLAMKNVLYAHVYSNCVNGVVSGDVIQYDISPWIFGIIGSEVFFGLVLAGMITWIILHYVRKPKEEKEAIDAEIVSEEKKK